MSSLMPSLMRVAAGVALVAVGPAAQAVAVAELSARSSVTYIHRFGGFAIAGDSGEDGSTAPLTALSPATLQLQDSHSYSGSYAYWSVDYTQTWDLSQSFALDPAAHTIAGSGSTHLRNEGAVVGLNCTPCLPTMQIDSQNTQKLDFTLTEASRYSFHSDNTQDEWVDLLVWSNASGGWATVWYGALVNQNRSWDSSGTLQAGLYRLQNNPYGQRSDGGQLLHDSAWSYTLTLPDAVVTPVPEPPAAALLLAGLWLVGAPPRIRALWRRVNHRRPTEKPRSAC